MGGFIALVASILAGLGLGARQRLLWQADLQIRSLVVSQAKGQLTARVVVGSEFGEALAARVEVFLPVGVGIVTLGPGCIAGPSHDGMSSLRARVECSLGDLPARSSRELVVVTTTPPTGVARGFGVVAMSDTPDPKPGNNFAERVIPREERDDRRDRTPSDSNFTGTGTTLGEQPVNSEECHAAEHSAVFQAA
jgi:hypothetical protein